MKLYRTNYDGHKERAVVAKTKKRACELIGVSLKSYSDFGYDPLKETDVEDSRWKSFFSSPEVVFERIPKIRMGDGVWRKIK